MALLVVYWLYTRGFSFDRPLGLRPRALSKLPTRVKPVNHAPPSYNLYIANKIVLCLKPNKVVNITIRTDPFFDWTTIVYHSFY